MNTKKPSSSTTSASPRSNGTSTLTSRQISSLTPSDEIGEKIRHLDAYADDDDEVSQTGNHNIVAMPGSHVHIASDSDDSDSEVPPRWLAPKWAKLLAKIIGALAGAGMVGNALYEAFK